MRTAQAAGPSCDEVLNSCDAALKAKQRELDLADLGVKLRSDEIERLGKENAELRDKGTSIFSNPFLWATIGLFVGSRVVR
jgi:hypothetical protein